MIKHKILILTNRIPYPLIDGGALAMHTMIEGYYKAGWNVSLLTMNTSRHFVAKDSLPELYQKIHYHSFDINTDVKFVPVLKNFFLSKEPNHAERFYDKEFDKKLKFVIEDFEPEIIQIESVYLATYISSIKEISRAKIILRLHNIEHHIWERLSSESRSIKKYYLKDLAARIKRFEINAWNQADVLLPITNTDATLASSLTKDKKVIVVPFGIYPKQNDKASLNEKWIAYHIGAMDWLPNAEGVKWFLEKAWPDIHKAKPEFEFHFAGRNMPGFFVKFEHDGVFCSGEVKCANEFIADKKILIVPIRSGGGIRVKILEAMAAGKIVISTAIGMQGIEAEDGVHFLLAEDANDFKDKIIWALDHKNEANAIASASKQLVFQKYNQDKITAQLISELETEILK